MSCTPSKNSLSMPYNAVIFLGLADVNSDDYYVPGCLVSILHCMSLGIIW